MSTTKKLNPSKPLCDIHGNAFKLQDNSDQLIGKYLAELVANTPCEEPTFAMSIAIKLLPCPSELELSKSELDIVVAALKKIKINLPPVLEVQLQDFLKGN